MLKAFPTFSAALLFAACAARAWPADGLVITFPANSTPVAVATNPDTPIFPATVITPAVPATAPAMTRAQLEAREYWIGVAVENIPPAIGKLMKLAPGQGLLIAAVVAGSPAASAKLQADDLLITINGEPLASQRQLVQSTNSLHQDAQGNWAIAPASIGYIRDGEHLTVDLTPAPRPEQFRSTGGPITVEILPNSGAPSQSPAVAGFTPNGLATLHVGPGIVLNLNAVPSSTSIGSSYQSAAKGQTVIFSEESDSLGHTHYSVIVGDKTYNVDPAHLETLPRDVQQLVRPFLPQRVHVANTAAPSGNRANNDLNTTLQEQIKTQQQQIDELTKQIKDLADLLKKEQDKP